MKINEATRCPICKADGRIYGIDNLFDDTRYDSMSCPECGAEWQVFYKITDVAVQVIRVPSKEEPENTDSAEKVDEVVEEVSDSVETTEQ